jgi:hypothetical protein
VTWRGTEESAGTRPDTGRRDIAALGAHRITDDEISAWRWRSQRDVLFMDLSSGYNSVGRLWSDVAAKAHVAHVVP